MRIEGYISLGLSNTYGNVAVYKSGEKFYMGLDDYASLNEVEISQELYEAIKNEFE